jgi:hypothetical protein
VLGLKYFGPEASEFYSIGNLIQGGIDGAIRDKICMLPPLLTEFIQEQVDFWSSIFYHLSHLQIDILMSPRNGAANSTHSSPTFSNIVNQNGNNEDEPPSVLDHICAAPIQPTSSPNSSSNEVLR